MAEVRTSYEPKKVFNRKERRYLTYRAKPTKFSHIKFDKDNNPIAYLHPTKGLKGNKKACEEIKKELKESK